MSIKKEIIDSLVRIMLNNKCKTNIDSLLCNRTYFFTYDMKTTKPRQFSDLKMFRVNNFQVCTSVALEMQLQSQNFKPKGANEITYRYFFKPVNLYHIKETQVAQLWIPKKRQKQDNNQILILPQTRITNSVSNLLQWFVTKDKKSKLPGS